MELVILSSLALLILIPNIVRRPVPKFTLQKNCLLTQNPILFINGPSSIVYNGNYWSHIPYILRQHGYKVFEFNFKQLSDTNCQFYLQSQSTNFHVFCDTNQITFVEQYLAKLCTSCNIFVSKEFNITQFIANNKNSFPLHFHQIQAQKTFLYHLHLLNLQLHNFLNANTYPLKPEQLALFTNSKNSIIAIVNELAEIDFIKAY